MVENFFTPGHAIERYAKTGVDQFGGETWTWATHLPISAKLWQLSGDKRLSADKTTVFTTHRAVTAIADIRTSDRYKDPAGVVYEIKAIAPRRRPDGVGHMEIDLELVL